MSFEKADVKLGMSIYLSLHGEKYSPTDNRLRPAVDSIINSNGFRAFYEDVVEEFATSEEFIEQINKLEKTWKLGGFPDSIFTMISPYHQSIITIDTTYLFIALNHYLGEKHPAYGSFPEYLKRNKNRDMIPYHIAEVVTRNLYPFPTDENSIISRMAYEGAILHNTLASVPDGKLELALGWTKEQLNYVEDNEWTIWRTFVENDLLYSDFHTISPSIFHPGQGIPFISSRCPGGIGRYLGYRILDNYLSVTPGKTVKAFLSETEYMQHDFLKKSKFQP